MNEQLVMILTLVSVLLIVYHHAGYPLALRWARRRHAEAVVEAAPRGYCDMADDAALPSVTLVIPAYNEQEFIAEKVRNLAALDYPQDRFQVVIACDGCTDHTVLRAQLAAEEPECRHLNLDVRIFQQNRGKIAVVNDVVSSLESDLVAFSDVSALVSVDALLIAARHFQDPQVGVVNAQYRLLKPGSEGEAAYWRYQSAIKAGEAALGSVLGSHGAFYLIRRELFRPLEADTINDDFILPMRIVAAGYRAVSDETINALELEQADSSLDQHRRRRIAAGNLQQLIRLRGMLLPRYRGVAFAFASGKALRVVMPFLMLLALVGSLALAPSNGFFALMAAGQVLVYAIAGWHQGCIKRNTQGRPNCFLPLEGSKTKRSGVFGGGRKESKSRLVKTIHYLVSGHLASLIGTLSYLAGRYRGHWKRVKA